MRFRAGKAAPPRIPLVVVGALRSGGSGKTSVTAALARHYRDHGCEVAVLAYRLWSGSERGGVLHEVREDTPWRESSEEAVLLKRTTGARVFATRDRAAAWRALEARGGFDLVLSDDGFQDPRLLGAFRVLLQAPGESPGLFDLLPAGPFRETRGAARRADLRLAGPLRAGGPAAMGNPGDPLAFRRRLVLPDSAGPAPAVFCALGDNRRFLADLAASGLRPAEVLDLADHAAPSPARLEALARRHPGAGILCTAKDFVKVDPALAARLGVRAVDQEISVDGGAFAAVDRYLAGFPRRNHASTGLSRTR